MLSILFTLFLLWAVFKIMGLFFSIFGRVIGAIFGIIGYLSIAVLAIAGFGLALVFVPVIIIAAIAAIAACLSAA